MGTTNSARSKESIESLIRIEIDTWFGLKESEREDDVSQLKQQFPHVHKLFVKYNTIISSSAPAERLFSFARMILRPQRQNLSDDRFEKLLILKHRNKRV